jgi:hypothetical protein
MQPVNDPIPAIGGLDHDLRLGPASATAAATANASFETRTELSFSPALFFRTITERRR